MQNSGSLMINETTEGKDGKPKTTSKLVDSGIEDFWMIKSPDLIAPLRPDSIAKYDNYKKLLVALQNSYSIYYSDPTSDIDALDKATVEYLSENSIEFKYFEDNNQFSGEKLIRSDELTTYVERLKNLFGTKAIITDNIQKYNSIPHEGIEIFDRISVQGNEFDYVLLDLPLSTDSMGRGQGALFTLKNIYTLTQRSRKGTYIVRNGIGSVYKDKFDKNSSGNLEISDKQKSDYKI